MVLVTIPFRMMAFSERVTHYMDSVLVNIDTLTIQQCLAMSICNVS